MQLLPLKSAKFVWPGKETTSKAGFICLLLALAVAVTLAGCNKPGGPLSGTVTVDGSTTLYPLTKAMAGAFRKSNPAVQFTVDFSGTGGGFKKFCAQGSSTSWTLRDPLIRRRANNAQPSTSNTSRCLLPLTASRSWSMARTPLWIA